MDGVGKSAAEHFRNTTVERQATRFKLYFKMKHLNENKHVVSRRPSSYYLLDRLEIQRSASHANAPTRKAVVHGREFLTHFRQQSDMHCKTFPLFKELGLVFPPKDSE